MSRLLWLAACALLSLHAGIVQAAPRFAEAEGTISAVSTVSVPATVTLSNAGGDVTVNVLPSTVIVVEGQGRVSVSALMVGAAAEAKYDLSSHNAKQIKVEAEPEEDEDATAIGIVLDADPLSGTVMIDTNNDTVADVTLTANADTKIEVDGVHLTLAELDALDGLRVRAEYLTATFVALEIEAAANATQTVNGTVSAIDPVAGTLTIETASGPLTFEVADAADIRLTGRKVTLAALQVGDVVEVRYVTDGTANTALRISARRAKPLRITGTISAVDAGAGTITVQARGTSVVLNVTASTDLRINGRPATLADLAAAVTAGGTVKVSAGYFARTAGNLATEVQVNVRGRGRR
ncbi:MAG: hypothetical protein K0Q72_3590 [Armatimonadetes bacterium]|nr:hypothetical protein [Armatimonadota bacterium]